MSFKFLFVMDLMFFSTFERAKIRIILMCVKKSMFFVKKIIIWFIVVYYKRNT